MFASRSVSLPPSHGKNELTVVCETPHTCLALGLLRSCPSEKLPFREGGPHMKFSGTAVSVGVLFRGVRPDFSISDGLFSSRGAGDLSIRDNEITFKLWISNTVVTWC